MCVFVCVCVCVCVYNLQKAIVEQPSKTSSYYNPCISYGLENIVSFSTILNCNTEHSSCTLLYIYKVRYSWSLLYNSKEVLRPKLKISTCPTIYIYM